MLKYDIAALRNRLEKLSPKQRSLFALDIARRIAHAKGNGPLETVLAEYEGVIANAYDAKLDEDDLASFFSAISTIAHNDNIDMTLATAERAYEWADTAAQDRLEVNSFDTETEKKLLENKIVQDELHAQEARLTELERNS
jgi:hypothetical protein